MSKPKACLTVQKGNEQGRQYIIRAGQEFVIGRSLGCSISLNDGLVSRRHCTLELSNNGLLVTDLGSRNGTILDGKKLVAGEGEVTAPKDVLQVGGHIFSVEITGLSQLNHESIAKTRRFAKRFVPPEEFELLGEIGRGATGIVYGARQLNLRRNVALKVPRTDVEDYTDSYTRFIREGQLCSKISSPHVVTVHDMRLSNKRVFIVMELINGGSVSDRIGNVRLTGKNLPLEEVARIGEHVALGLHAIHRHKIIHRDLKPSNILLSPDGNAKLADFGIAKFIGEDEGDFAPMTGSDEGVGTIGYLSPEAVGASETVTPLSDIYSLGATLYHMLTNKILFMDTNFERALMRILEETPIPIRKLRPDCPSALASLVEKMLEKDPTKRPQDALNVAIQLNSIAGEFSSLFTKHNLQQTDMYRQPSYSDKLQFPSSHPRLDESRETDIFF